MAPFLLVTKSSPPSGGGAQKISSESESWEQNPPLLLPGTDFSRSLYALPQLWYLKESPL